MLQSIECKDDWRIENLMSIGMERCSLIELLFRNLPSGVSNITKTSDIVAGVANKILNVIFWIHVHTLEITLTCIAHPSLTVSLYKNINTIYDLNTPSVKPGNSMQDAQIPTELTPKQVGAERSGCGL